MSRYIDAELFAKDLRERWTTADKNAEKKLSNIISSLVVPILIGVPTADVEEVQHANWVCVKNDKHSNIYECSICGRAIRTNCLNDFPYCHCGAKMDLEV